MATLAKQTITRDGLTPAFAAAAAGGDEFANTGAEFVYIKNAGAGTPTVTCVTQATVDGQAVGDRAVVVPAGGEIAIGPFPVDTYNDSDGNVQLTYSDETDLTVAVITI